MKEDAKSDIALTHSRKCTKELISALPNLGSMETLGARADKRNFLGEKKRRQTCFQCLCCRYFFVCFVGSVTQVM